MDLLSAEELDRDFAEVSLEIEFLEAQVQSELESYSPVALKHAENKILVLKRKAENLKNEIEMRKKQS